MSEIVVVLAIYFGIGLAMGLAGIVTHARAWDTTVVAAARETWILNLFCAIMWPLTIDLMLSHDTPYTRGYLPRRVWK